MSSNHHTPLVPGESRANTTDLNAPLAELDEAISGKANSDHTHEGLLTEDEEENLKTTSISVSYPTNVKPIANEVVNVMVPCSITFPSDLAGSLYHAQVAPDSNVTVSFQKNGSEFGSLSVSSGSSSGTFSGDGTTFLSGDRLSFSFPSSQDANWSGINISLKGTKVI